MPTPPFDENAIIEDLTAIFRRARGNCERESRISLFESLSELEKKAYLRGAPDGVLNRVAESRFLAGILREAVTPVRHQSPRGGRHFWTSAPDLHASREPA